jgi:hypothetical protein
MKNIHKIGNELYITSDEEIKDGEYGLSRLGEIIKFHSGYDYRYYAKIILTTDQDLIKDGVQVIDDEFLEWFVKNPSCEYVEVEEEQINNKSGSSYSTTTNYKYKIIIPKEEPKQELLPDFKITKNIFDFVTDLSDTKKEEPKYITVKEPCSLCDGTGETTFSGTYTTQRKCDLCNGEKYWNKKILVDQPKQETLEEAAYRLSAEKFEPKHIGFMLGVIEGAKWQAEKIPSIIEEYLETAFISKEQGYMNPKEWLEQFKKI